MWYTNEIDTGTPSQASQLLKKLYTRLMVRKYVRGISPQRKAQVIHRNPRGPGQVKRSENNLGLGSPACFQLLLKAQTSTMFKGKKENYPFSVCRPFADTRICKTQFQMILLENDNYT